MPPSTKLYSAFALTIESAIPLVELPPGSGDADVTVSVAPLGIAAPESDAWSINAGVDETSGWAPGAGAFLVRNGSEIVVDPMPRADDRALRMAIVGPLLGVILSQRGRFVLHASTVVIDDVAVAFAGPSGRGKSTLTAALARAGYPLVADDMTVIDTVQRPPLVQPGFPRVKLWPDSAGALDERVEELPLIHPEIAKRSLELRDAFHAEPVPLRRCYILEDGDSEAIEEIPPREAIFTLVRSTYQAAWMHETGASGRNLQHCGDLVRSGVVRRLRRRKRFDVLPDVLRFIEADVRG